MTYTVTDAAEILSGLQEHFPAVSAQLSTLGGPQNASIIIILSLDKKETWINGIYQNSRFSMFSLNNGKLEQIAKHHQLSKFRKSTIKSNDDVVSKIVSWSTKQN